MAVHERATNAQIQLLLAHHGIGVNPNNPGGDPAGATRGREREREGKSDDASLDLTVNTQQGDDYGAYRDSSNFNVLSPTELNEAPKQPQVGSFALPPLPDDDFRNMGYNSNVERNSLTDYNNVERNSLTDFDMEHASVDMERISTDLFPDFSLDNH